MKSSSCVKYFYSKKIVERAKVPKSKQGMKWWDEWGHLRVAAACYQNVINIDEDNQGVFSSVANKHGGVSPRCLKTLAKYGSAKFSKASSGSLFKAMQGFIKFTNVWRELRSGWDMNTCSSRSPLRNAFCTSIWRTDHWKERARAKTSRIVVALTTGSVKIIYSWSLIKP